MSVEPEKVAVAEVTREDIRWINQRIDKISRRQRLILAVLIDKKLIGGELAKRIEESLQKQENDDKKLIDWLMSTLEKKK